MGLGDPPHQLIFAEIQRCIILEAPSSPRGDPSGGSLWGIPQLSFLWGIPQESPWGIPQTGNPATHQVWKPPHLGDPPMIAPGIPLQNSGSPRIRLEAPTSGGSPFFTSGSPLIMHESLQLRVCHGIFCHPTNCNKSVRNRSISMKTIFNQVNIGFDLTSGHKIG